VLDATSGHAEGRIALTPEQQKQIAYFEMGLVTAQLYDYFAGPLHARGAKGGAKFISEQLMREFYVGINAPSSANRARDGLC
jgi:hypothetical protein